MGEAATPIRRRLELSIAEARLRFQQLVRVTGLTGQVTVVVDGGKPIAAIVPIADLPGDGPPVTAPAAGAPPAPVPPRPGPVAPQSGPVAAQSGPVAAQPAAVAAAPVAPAAASAPAQRRPVAPIHAAEGVADGWMRRIEKVREDVRRQHAGRISELSRALDEAWQALDAVRPAGTDRMVDTLRAAHADLRPPR